MTGLFWPNSSIISNFRFWKGIECQERDINEVEQALVSGEINEAEACLKSVVERPKNTKPTLGPIRSMTEVLAQVIALLSVFARLLPLT